MSRTPLKSRIIIWAVLYVALAAQTYRYFGGSVYYGEYLHWTGVQATRLLMLVLAVTPLRRLFPGSGWIRWLLQRRRDLGVATFFYASAHAIAYLDYQQDLKAIVEDSLTGGMLAGWLAVVVLLLLAATSNNYSTRRLRGRWKSLHRSVYLGAVLTFAHWILTAFDPNAGYLHLAVLAVLMLLRLVGARRSTGDAVTSGTDSA